jgi:diguanylate cyclase (GGDEF)-like protein
MASLSALDDPVAIAAAVLQAACELMGLESGALVVTAAETGAIGAAALGRAPLATTGPLGELLAATPGAIRLAADDGTAHLVPLARPAAAADHGAAARLRAAGARTLVTVGLSANAGDRGALLLAGTGTGTAPGARGRAVSIDDLELLELLAAHAATCLRTADLVRSLRERAATDPLTGLGHHATFHEALARTHRRPQTAVVLVDVDGFKRVNDTHGHQHGDHVLRSIAHALAGALRRGDTLYRVGGDEFAALLAVGDPVEAHDAGLRLRAAVAAADLGVTVSIGVAVPHEGEPDGAVLDRADRALYRVKDAGRDGVSVAPPEAPPVVPPV